MRSLEGVEIAWARATGDGTVPGEQHAALFGPYSARIAPTGDAHHGAWTWSVHHAARPEPVMLGFAYDERDARRAVREWCGDRAPRSWRRRLRVFDRGPR